MIPSEEPTAVQEESVNPVLDWMANNQPTLLVALFISYTMGAFDYASSTLQGCIA